ncbi:S46 family peptidase [Odoribacter lunatus]|uniref:S46 family peptidase n=1 Tax=Odoribacter lunatus TaxID=2941335 RepID=UPI00203C15EE|nr:S46 family peptidase [Odoribacter lunatus]
MKKLLSIVCMLALFSGYCIADEGMWIPMLLKKYNIEDMQKKGFKLTAEDIYDINRASLKDAVVGLGREGSPFHHFCTGEFISSEGLLVTNHHCSFNMIQNHSSLEHNYLRDGFWAKNRSEELANPGITVSVLVRMEDVTEQITSQLSDDMTAKERNAKIKEIAQKLEQQAAEGTNLKANIKSYFNGNQFFMSVFRIFKDVRLVGAPASAIGKFGGDTDNWMWPRHTGDFSVLRVYADENNQPAGYSEKNRPYRPDAFFKISAKGIKEGDFTMIFGYPGTTNEYLPSYAIKQLIDIENPHKIAIRTAILDKMNEAMNRSELLRIKYAAKAANVANAWKKWQGELKGLKRFNTVGNKEKTEAEFAVWAKGRGKYDGIMERYASLYDRRKDLILASVYAGEAGLRGAEIIGLARNVYEKVNAAVKSGDKKKYEARLQAEIAAFFKDYDAETDRRILAEMLNLYNTNLSDNWIPEEVKKARNSAGYDTYARNIFNKSALTTPEGIKNITGKWDSKALLKLEKDPICRLALSIRDFNTRQILPELVKIETALRNEHQIWLAGLMEMQPEKVFYADANSTLRVAYGQVSGYTPVDAVKYTHYTTLTGIMEKDRPDIYDYNIPQALRDIYASKDFGPYTQDGDVPVCFIATNHTTGGNSGSPVLNAEGHLIGINFDRAWDGVMSDMQYDPAICRNVAVDIRYVLFVIDKVAGAGHLLEEMEIVR